MELALAIGICIALNTAVLYVVANDFETGVLLTGQQALGLAAAVTLVPLVASWALIG